MKNNQILLTTGTDYKEMTKDLCAFADLCQMIPSKDFKIAIKPNLVVAGPAELGATTHKEVLAGIIEYLKENGFNNLVLMESSWYGEDTDVAFSIAGYDSICLNYDVPFIDIKKTTSHKRNCGGMDIYISDALNDIGFFINVPVLKGHCQTKMTCALKNLKGIIPDYEKRRFPSLGIHKPVGHLASGVKQDFIIVDNICGDLDFEEGGNPVVRNCILAGVDPVLIDAYACNKLHLSVDSVPYIKIAESLGVGTSDLSKAEIVCLRESLDEILPKNSRILDVAYAAEAIDACSGCYGNLIPALLKLSDEGLLEKLNTKIAIGQGQSSRVGKLGVGDCTSGFDICIKGCPPSKDDIYQALREYIGKYCTE